MCKKIILSVLLVYSLQTHAQVTIEHGAVFYIQGKASVTLEGDLSSHSNIMGDGVLELTGRQISGINLHGLSVANLVINSPAILHSDLSVLSNLTLGTGRLQLNEYNVLLEKNASASGSDQGYMLITGTGLVKKVVDGKIGNYAIPIGTSENYMPVEISTGENSKKGMVSVNVVDKASDRRPGHIKNFLKYHWFVRQEGDIQDLRITGYYRKTDIQGNARDISSYYWDGFSWKSQVNFGAHAGKAIAAISSPEGELYAMDLENTAAEMKVLYNPARSFTILEINTPVDKAYHVVLRDATGRQLQQTDIKLLRGVNRHTVYLGGLSQGPYFLDVISSTERQSLKFLKIR